MANGVRTVSPGLDRFNEARADQPGKSRARARSARARRRASMRPGPISPGNLGRYNPHLHAGASMRPGPISPGNNPPDRGNDLQFQASMRPGPISPGNRGRHPPVHRDECSMRPGPISPGNGTLQPARAGRFNEARADQPGKSDRAGHPILYRFNEARADQPGKCHRRVRARPRRASASMRPGPISPGNSPPPKFLRRRPLHTRLRVVHPSGGGKSRPCGSLPELSSS